MFRLCLRFLLLPLLALALSAAALAEEQGAAPAGLPYQVQLLEQEIMQLRGQVEELTYRLERIERRHDDRYRELDRRLVRLMQEGVAGLDAGAGAAAPPPAGPPPAAEAPLDEQGLYDSALQLIRIRQYDPAIVRLEELIAKFPEGELTANAYYWLGEVHAAKPTPDYEKARQALVQVITNYPEHRKTADAGFKLGKVYYRMGDCARAANILRQVMTQFADQTVARLAEDYLNGLECDS